MTDSPQCSLSSIQPLAFESFQPDPVPRRGSSFRTSHYPKTPLTPELQRKVAMFGAFKVVVASGDFRKKESQVELERARTAVSRLRTRRNDTTEATLTKSLYGDKRCSECKAVPCHCNSRGLGEGLIAVGKRARTASPLNYPADLSAKLGFRLQTTGSNRLKSTLRSGRSRLFVLRRKSPRVDGLTSLLQISTLTPLQRSKSSRFKFQFPSDLSVKDISQNT